MKYTLKEATRMFNCSKKDIIRALNNYGYYSKKSIIDDKCIDYLEKMFAYTHIDFSDKVSISSDKYVASYEKNNSLEGFLKEEFEKDNRAFLDNYENSIENIYIDELITNAQTVDFYDDNIFDFLKGYYPDLYSVAKNAITAYKTIGYLDHYARYCLNDIGLFMELFVTYLLNRNGLVNSCKSTYGNDSNHLFSKICCLANHGLPQKIVDLLNSNRIIRNKIHVLIESSQAPYTPGSYSYSFIQEITENDCYECLKNIYILSCWLVGNEDIQNMTKNN